MINRLILPIVTSFFPFILFFTFYPFPLLFFRYRVKWLISTAQITLVRGVLLIFVRVNPDICAHHGSSGFPGEAGWAVDAASQGVHLHHAFLTLIDFLVRYLPL